MSLCNRTLQDFIDHLGCSLNDLEGSELRRIAQKACDYDPDEDDQDDGIDYTFEPCEEELNHVTWSEKWLTSVINDAFRILHLERNDLFNNRIKVKLKPGCPVQQLDESCCKFGGDIRNDACDGQSKPIEISETQLRVSEQLGKIFCKGQSSNQKYTVKGASFNPLRPKEFVVNPPPPYGVDTYVTYMCVGKAPCFEWDRDKDVIITEDCSLNDYHPWFIEYALFRAHMTDRESESSVAVADRHWQNGFRLISNGKQSDYMFYHPDLYLIGPIKEGTGERIILQSGE